MTYQEKLKDPRWQKKRLEILRRDAWGCIICGETKKTLHVHHKNYLKGKNPWDIPSDMLVTLCEDCHKLETERIKDTTAFLCHAMKKHFLSPQIYCIANGIYNIQIAMNEEVTASMIEWALKDKKVMEELCEKYFEYLSKKRVM